MIVDIIQVQRNVSLPTSSCLSENAGIGIDRVIEEIGYSLIERIDSSQHTLDPTFSQLRFGPG